MVEGVIGNVERYITPKKTFGHKLVNLLRLFSYQIEGCPPGVDLATKKGEVDEWTAEVEGPMAEEWDCGIGPPSEALVPVFLSASSSSFLRARPHPSY
jgi:hypothetical protein